MLALARPSAAPVALVLVRVHVERRLRDGVLDVGILRGHRRGQELTREKLSGGAPSGDKDVRQRVHPILSLLLRLRLLLLILLPTPVWVAPHLALTLVLMKPMTSSTVQRRPVLTKVWWLWLLWLL